MSEYAAGGSVLIGLGEVQVSISITDDGLPGTWKCLGARKVVVVVVVVGVAHLGSG